MPRSDQEAFLNAYLRNYVNAQDAAVRKGKNAVHGSMTAGIGNMNYAKINMPNSPSVAPVFYDVIADQMEQDKAAFEKAAEQAAKEAQRAAERAAKEEDKLLFDMLKKAQRAEAAAAGGKGKNDAKKDAEKAQSTAPDISNVVAKPDPKAREKALKSRAENTSKKITALEKELAAENNGRIITLDTDFGILRNSKIYNHLPKFIKSGIDENVRQRESVKAKEAEIDRLKKSLQKDVSALNSKSLGSLDIKGKHKREAVWNTVNDWKETNRDVYEKAKKGGSGLLPAQKEAAEHIIGLEKELPFGYSTAHRTGRALNSLGNKAVARLPVLMDTLERGVEEKFQNDNNPEYWDNAVRLSEVRKEREAMERETNRLMAEAMSGGMTGNAVAKANEIQKELQEDTRYQELQREEERLAKIAEKERANIPTDPDFIGNQIMRESIESAQEGQKGLSDTGKKAFNIASSVAENVGRIPVAVVSPGTALAMAGASASAQDAYDRSAQGMNALDTAWRSAATGLIEAGTEKIGMDNVLSILGSGGKKALRESLGVALKETVGVKKIAADIAMNFAAEGSEEVLSDFANYVVDIATINPDAELDAKQLWDDFVAGGIAGSVLGGGASVVNAIANRHSVNPAAESVETDPDWEDVPDATEAPVETQNEIVPENVPEPEIVPVQDTNDAEILNTVKDLVSAYQSGTMTNKQIAMLSPNGPYKNLFEAFTGVVVPQTNSQRADFFAGKTGEYDFIPQEAVQNPIPTLQESVAPEDYSGYDVPSIPMLQNLIEANNDGSFTNKQIGMLMPGSKYRAAFEDITGEALPATAKETKRSLRMTPEVRTLEQHYLNGTLTNNEIESLKPNGEMRNVFEHGTGLELPDSNKATRKALMAKSLKPFADGKIPSLNDYVDMKTMPVYNESKQGGLKNERAGNDGISEVPGNIARQRQGMGTANGKRGGKSGGHPVFHRNVTANKAVRDAVEKFGSTPIQLNETTEMRKEFSAALDEAIKSNKYGLMVSPKSVEELSQAGTRTFMTDDRKAGMLVTADGDIEGVFKTKGGPAKRAVAPLMLEAISQGGKKLDCYGKNLVNKYAAFGFEPVARVDFNPEYAPEGWNYGSLDVYAMKLKDGLTVEEIADRINLPESEGGFHSYSVEELNDLKHYNKDGYDDAMAYRDSLIRKSGDAKHPAFFDAHDEFGKPIPALGNPNTVGSKEASYGAKEVLSQDTANRERAMQNLSDQQAKEADVEHYHTLIPNAESKEIAQQNLDLAKETLGKGAVEAEMNELRTKSGNWNDVDVQEAIKIQNALNREFAALDGKEGTPEYAIALQRYNNWNKTVHEKIGDVARALQNAKTRLDAVAVAAKTEAWKKEQTDSWKKTHVRKAKKLDNLAGELSNTEIPQSEYQKEMLRFALKTVKEKAKAQNIEVTTEQAKQLAADMVLGHSQETIYNDLVEFKAGLGSLSAKAVNEIDGILKAAEQYPEDSKQRMDLESKVYGIIASELNPHTTFTEKLNAYRYMAMLGNTRTHVRNMIGNTSMDALARTKDLVGTLIEASLEKTGKMDKSERTKTVLTNSAEDKALRGGAYKYAENMVYRTLTGDSRFNVEKGIRGQKQVFKTQPLEAVRKMNNASLEGEDVKGMVGVLAGMAEGNGKLAQMAQQALEKHDLKGEAGKNMLGGLQNSYAHSLAMTLKARGYDASIFDATDAKSQQVLESASAAAMEEAMRNTFHEDSAAANSLSSIKSKPIKAMLEAILPFKKTPINIAKQGVRYSPVGFANTVYHHIKGDKTTSQIADMYAQNLTGSAAVALGIMLAAQGLLRGSSDEEEKNFNKMQGKQDYAIDLGDAGTYTIDWLSPTSIPLLVGAEIYGTFKHGTSAEELIDAIANIGEPMLQTTFLQGIDDTLEAIKFAKGHSLSAITRQAATSLANQFVPTAVGQLARTLDPLRRSTYGGGDTKSKRDFTYGQTKLENKIPFLSQTNEPYVDAWGREQKNADFGLGLPGRALNNMLSPGFYSENATTETDSRLSELYEATNDKNVLPSLAPRSVTIDKQDYYFTPSEYHDFAVKRGEVAKEFVDEALSNPTFTSLPDAQQAELIPKLYNVSTHIAAGEVLDNYENGNTEYRKWKEVGSDNLIPVLLSGNKVNADNASQYDDVYESIYSMPNMSNEEHAIAYVANNSRDKKSKEIYNDYGADVMSNYLAIRSALNGSRKKDEIISMLDGTGMSDSDKALYFSLLADYNNPYE